MSLPQSLPERVIELESLIVHLQNDFDQLNGVVLEQQAQIETLKAALVKLEEQSGADSDGTESRDLESERPPHY